MSKEQVSLWDLHNKGKQPKNSNHQGMISILDLFNKVHYLHTNMTPDKIVMKELPDAEIGFYMVDKNQSEVLVGVVSEDDYAIVTTTGRIQIGGFYFSGFRVEHVTFENTKLEEIQDDRS